MHCRLSRFQTGWLFFWLVATAAAQSNLPPQRVYQNRLTRIENPKPLLADHPEFFEPIIEQTHFEAPPLVVDQEADLHVRAWRFSYNARGIIEIPNHLKASQTAVIMVHPWGIDDGQGWNTPEPAGVADFCTVQKNHLAARHTRQIVRPFINGLREKAACVMYSLPGTRDPIRHKLYRSLVHTPTAEQRRAGAVELTARLRSFDYRGKPLPKQFSISRDQPVVDYFRQFPGLAAGAQPAWRRAASFSPAAACTSAAARWRNASSDRPSRASSTTSAVRSMWRGAKGRFVPCIIKGKVFLFLGSNMQPIFERGLIILSISLLAAISE